MKKSSLIRAFLSIVIVALGGVLLLKNLGIINFSWDIFWGTVWAAGFVLSGLVNIFNYRKNRTSWIWGLLLVAIGVLIGLNSYGIVDVSVWQVFWPVVLIAVGLAIMFNASPKGVKRSKKLNKDNAGNEKIACFWGEEDAVKGDYTGGSLVAIFGGVDLDLRQAKIKDGSVIEIFTFCGGVNITLPDDVIIKNEVRGFLGGTDDKTLHKDSAKKTLYLKGECILGGLEIK